MSKPFELTSNFKPAGDQPIAIIHTQSALRVRIGRMTIEAVVRQQRPDLLLEEFGLGRVGLGVVRRGGAPAEGGQDAP